MSGNTIINSVGEFISLLNLTPDTIGKIPVYRGEPTLYDLPCEPKAFRAGSTYRLSSSLNFFDSISLSVNKWKKDVIMSEGRSLITANQLEDMILAQH